MLHEALTYLVGLGKASAEVRKHGLPGNKMLLVKPDGTSEVLDRDRKVRKDQVKSIADLVEWVEWVLQNMPAGQDVECFVQGGMVVVSINREDIVSDSTNVGLANSVEWTAMLKLISGPITQKDLLKMLRGPLARAGKPVYVSIFKSITFRSSATTDRGVSTLGRSVDMAVASAAGDIPDSITLNVPVFDPAIAPISVMSIELCVDVNFEQERFEFYPVGDALQVAQTNAQSEIRGLLRESLPEGSLIVLGTEATCKAK